MPTCSRSASVNPSAPAAAESAPVTVFGASDALAAVGCARDRNRFLSASSPKPSARWSEKPGPDADASRAASVPRPGSDARVCSGRSDLCTFGESSNVTDRRRVVRNGRPPWLNVTEIGFIAHPRQLAVNMHAFDYRAVKHPIERSLKIASLAPFRQEMTALALSMRQRWHWYCTAASCRGGALTGYAS